MIRIYKISPILLNAYFILFHRQVSVEVNLLAGMNLRFDAILSAHLARVGRGRIGYMSASAKVVALPSLETASISPLGLNVGGQIAAVAWCEKVCLLVESAVGTRDIGRESAHPAGASIVPDVDTARATRAICTVVDINDKCGCWDGDAGNSSQGREDGGGGKMHVGDQRGFEHFMSTVRPISEG